MKMENAVQAINRKAASGDESLCGNVRIATTDTLAEAFVMPALQDLRERYPAITVTLLTAVNIADISYHGADLAIRGARPDDDELIIKRLATIEMGLYATQHYLARRGMPVRGEQLRGHDLLMFRASWCRDTGTISAARPCTSPTSCCNAIRSCCCAPPPAADWASVCSPRFGGQRPELVRLFPENKDWVDIWLVLHPDLQRAARVRGGAGAGNVV